MKINLDIHYTSVEDGNDESGINGKYKAYPMLKAVIELDIETLRFIEEYEVRESGTYISKTLNAILNTVKHTCSEISKQVQIN